MKFWHDVSWENALNSSETEFSNVPIQKPPSEAAIVNTVVCIPTAKQKVV
jgi:hypothetical protein